jgi:hypothetical protein
MNGVAVVKNNVTGLDTNCIETTFLETVQAGAVTPTFSMNSVAMDCPGYIKTDSSSGGATVAQVDAIVKAGSNNLYGANSGGGTYTNTLSGVVNGSAETAATVTAIPEAYNTDGWFTTPTYVGAVSSATDTWYKNWTLSGTIEVQ